MHEVRPYSAQDELCEPGPIMIVKNNKRWLKVIAMGKRAPRHNVGVYGPAFYDYSKCKTLNVRFTRAKLGKKRINRRWSNRLCCHISPGRY
jgi:hypothetical protein